MTATCGIEFDQVIPYMPLVDEACRLAEHQVDGRMILAGPEATYALSSGDVDWGSQVKRPQPRLGLRSRQLIRFTSCIPRNDREA